MFGGILAQGQADTARARTYLEASATLWRSVDDQVGLAMTLARLGADYTLRGEFERADTILNEALALARRGGEAVTLAGVLNSLGIFATAKQRYEDAASHLRESLGIARTVERTSYRTYTVVNALVLLGRVESKFGACASAISLFEEALVDMRASGLSGVWLGHCLDWLAAALDKAGDPLRAARLFGAADAHWRTVGVARSFPLSDEDHEEDVRAVQAQLGLDVFVRAISEGAAMNMARVFAVALNEVVS
jgi:tetratricopeptide (TPR) repeat protein